MAVDQMFEGPPVFRFVHLDVKKCFLYKAVARQIPSSFPVIPVQIRFDKWYAYIQSGPWIKELLYLRSQVMPQFKERCHCHVCQNLSRKGPFSFQMCTEGSD